MNIVHGVFVLVVQVNWLFEICSIENTTSVASMFLYKSEREKEGY